MKLICPHCGEEVRKWDYIDHTCAPSIENGNPKEEHKFGFVDWLKEWWVYCIFTPTFSPIWSKFNEENKFDILKGLLYNTTTIIIPIWLLSLLIYGDLLSQLGDILGFIVLVSPPFLIYFAWKFMLKGENTYTSIFLTGHILIIIFYILFIYFIMMMTSS